jgi:hypothetical protein
MHLVPKQFIRPLVLGPQWRLLYLELCKRAYPTTCVGTPGIMELSTSQPKWLMRIGGVVSTMGLRVPRRTKTKPEHGTPTIGSVFLRGCLQSMQYSKHWRIKTMYSDDGRTV